MMVVIFGKIIENYDWGLIGFMRKWVKLVKFHGVHGAGAGVATKEEKRQEKFEAFIDRQAA